MPELEPGIIRRQYESPIIGGGTGGTASDANPHAMDAATAFLPQTESAEALPLSGKVVLITGASRGIGAEMAKTLGSLGATVVGPHRDETKHKRIDPMVKEIVASGGNFISPIADITTQEGRERIMSTLGETNTRVDIIVHNAAGGLEDWATPEYNFKINAMAKQDLTLAVAAHNQRIDSEQGVEEGERSLVVIDTPSLWSLFYGKIDQLDKYDPVAESKFAGMGLLAETVDALNESGQNAKLLMLCGHGIQDTTTWKGFERMDRQKPEEERRMPAIRVTAAGGDPPKMADMARGLANFALNHDQYPNGYVEFVGIPHWDSSRVHDEMGQVYGPKAERINDIIFFGDQAFAHYTTPADDERNPFTEENGALQLVASDVLTEEGKASRTYSLAVNEKHTVDHMKDRGVFKGVYSAEASKQASEAFLRDRLGLTPDQGLRIKSINGVEFAIPILHENITIEVAETDNPLTTTAVVRKQSGDIASTIGTLEFEVVLIDQVDRGFSEADVVEAAAQAGGAVYFKNKYYPEVTPEGADPVDTNVSKEIDMLPLFSGWQSVTYEDVKIDPTKGFTTHVKVGRQDRKGFGEDAKIYQGDTLVATVQTADCKLMSIKAFNYILDRSEPKQPSAN